MPFVYDIPELPETEKWVYVPTICPICDHKLYEQLGMMLCEECEFSEPLPCEE